MRHDLELEIALPHVRIELATITWEQESASPLSECHALFQRLSHGHSALRIGQSAAFDLLPRVRSIGFLPAGHSVPLMPIEGPLRVLSCFYDADFVAERTGISREEWSEHAEVLAFLRSKRLEILMQELHAELDQPGLAHHFLAESLANVMLVELARLFRQLERRRSRHGIVLALAPWQLRRIEERINGSLEQGYPGLGELAELCGVSEGHLARSFKVTTGWQLHKYIAELRIATAREMLGKGDCSCETVAAKLGFSSPGYFATVFRRVTGVRPSDFRRKALAR